MNRFLNAPAPRGRVASGAPRCAPLEPTPLPNRLRHVRARDPRPRLHTPRNAPRLEDCRTPPDPPPRSQPMFVAERTTTRSSTTVKPAKPYAPPSRRSRTPVRRLPARSKSHDRTTLRCAPVEAETLPLCLRSGTDHSPTPGETTKTLSHPSHRMAAPTATLQAPFTTFRSNTFIRRFNVAYQKWRQTET